MKNFTRIMIAAAAAAVAAVSASAQTLKAEVPFAFRAAAGTFEPGTYQVRVGLDGIVYWYNADTRTIAMTKPAGTTEAKKAWKQDELPRLEFECANGECGLLSMYAADGNPALRFYGLKNKNLETHVAMIPMTVAKR